MFPPLQDLKPYAERGNTTIGLDWIGLDWIGLDWIARRYERPEERRSVISWKSKFLTMSFCQEFV